MSHNKISAHFEITAGNMLVFPFDDHRTDFWLQDLENQDLNVWVGPNPPATLSFWFHVGGTGTSNILTFSNGVFGPLYVCDRVGGTADCIVMSASATDDSIAAGKVALVPLPV